MAAIELADSYFPPRGHFCVHKTTQTVRNDANMEYSIYLKIIGRILDLKIIEGAKFRTKITRPGWGAGKDATGFDLFERRITRVFNLQRIGFLSS